MGALSLAACKSKSNGNGNGAGNGDLPESDTLITFSIDREDAGYEFLGYDNIVESVRFIPLTDTVGVNIHAIPCIYACKINGKYCVTNVESGSWATSVLYDGQGRYITKIFNVGRGPNELAGPMVWFWNDKTGKVYYVDPHEKILGYDVESGVLTPYRIPTSELKGRSLYNWVSFDDGTFAGAENTALYPEYDENEYPYLYGFDTDLRLNTKVFYPEKRKIYQKMQYQDNIPREFWHLVRTGVGVRFADMYNDTIYALESDLSKKPLYVISRSIRQMPDYSDTRSPNGNRNKLYFQYMTDSERYFWLGYVLNDEFFSVIWDKKEGRQIMHQRRAQNFHARAASAPFRFDGFEGWLPISYVTPDNEICVVLPVGQVKPELADQVDYILIEIKLKM